MQILLAPMEGLLDAPLRDILTRAGGVDRCVSEFIRVTERVLPERAFRRIMPELGHGGRTPAGVPVRGQLLGSDAACMADNAARLAELGSPGVDLNFGCPAKVVNRHGGGASLLQDPEDVHRVVKAVRAAVPSHIVVSAKMRLGFHDDALAEDNARAIEAAGADELVVHGRTWADWSDLQPLLHRYWQLIQLRVVPKHQAGRMKQWLNFLRRRHPQAEEAYQGLRTLNDSRQVAAWLDANLARGDQRDPGPAGSEVGDNPACAPLAA